MRARTCFGLLPAVALLCAAPAASALTYSNPAPITIVDAGVDSGLRSVPSPSSPYPSQLRVTGAVGTVTNATVTLHGFHHQCPQDVDMVLAGPRGQTTYLMSDAGDCREPASQPAPVNLTFADGAGPVPCFDPTAHPQSVLAGGTYAPTNDPAAPDSCASAPDAFSAPAPAGPYSASLGAFNGVDPNGVWSLYTMDDTHGDTGAVDAGWSLDLTIPAAGLVSAPTISGSPEAGATLTAVSGTVTGGGAPSYRWSRCDSRGKRCRTIRRANAATYRPGSRDRGHRLRVTERAKSSGGDSRAKSSAASGVIGPALIRSRTKTTQRALAQGGVVVSLVSNLRGRVAVSAAARVPGGRVVHFRRAGRRLKAGRLTSLRLRLPGAVGAALRRGSGVTARLRLTVIDGHGGRSTKPVAVRLLP